MWQVAGKGGRRVEGVEGVRRLMGGRRVAVDLSIWIVQALPRSTGRFTQKAVWDPDSGMPPPRTDRVDVLRTLFFRTLALRQMGCTPVFCADGQPPSAKNATRVARARRGGGGGGGSGGGGGQSQGGTSQMPRNAGWQSLEGKVVELLEALGMRVVRARGEAEALCAWMVRCGYADLVLSRDSDALVYGAPLVVKELDLFGAVKKGGEQKGSVGADVYSLQLLEEHGGIDRAGLLVACVLQGNDYDQGKGVERLGWKGVQKFIAHLRSRVFVGRRGAAADTTVVVSDDEEDEEDNEEASGRAGGRAKKDKEVLASATLDEIAQMGLEADERRKRCVMSQNVPGMDTDAEGLQAREVLKRMVENPGECEDKMFAFFGLHTSEEVSAMAGGAVRAAHCTRCGLEGMKNQAGTVHERCAEHPGARPRAKARESNCRCAWHEAMRRVERLDWEKPLRRTLQKVRQAARAGTFAPDEAIALFSEAGSPEAVLRGGDLRALRAAGPLAWARDALGARPRASESVLATLLAEDADVATPDTALAVSHLDLKVLAFSAADAIDRALLAHRSPTSGEGPEAESLPVPALVLKAVDKGAGVLVGWAAPGSGEEGVRAVRERVRDETRQRLDARGGLAGKRSQGRPLRDGLPGTKPEALADHFDLRCFTVEDPDRVRRAFPRLWEAYEKQNLPAAVPAWSRRLEDFPGFHVVKATDQGKATASATGSRPPPSPRKRRADKGFDFGHMGEWPSQEGATEVPVRMPVSPGKRVKPVGLSAGTSAAVRPAKLSLDDLLSDGLEEKALDFMHARQGPSVDVVPGGRRVKAVAVAMPAAPATPSERENKRDKRKEKKERSPTVGSKGMGKTAGTLAPAPAACDVIDLTQD